VGDNWGAKRSLTGDAKGKNAAVKDQRRSHRVGAFGVRRGGGKPAKRVVYLQRAVPRGDGHGKRGSSFSIHEPVKGQLGKEG